MRFVLIVFLLESMESDYFFRQDRQGCYFLSFFIFTVL